MFWPIWALLLLRATGKGGTASGSYGGTGGVYSGGGIVASRAAYASIGAFAAVVLLSAGSRRRYGTYYDPQDAGGLCTLLSEDEMNSSCSNLIGNETVCHDCIACETEDCMTEISNCDEFLATVFTECCVEDCDVGSSTPITALFAVVASIVFCLAGGFIVWSGLLKMKAALVHPSAVPGAPPSDAWVPASQPQIHWPVQELPGSQVNGDVKGQVVGISSGKA